MDIIGVEIHITEKQLYLSDQGFHSDHLGSTLSGIYNESMVARR